MPIQPANLAKPRLRSSDGSFAARGTVTGKTLRKVWQRNPASPLSRVHPSAPPAAQFSDLRRMVSFHTDLNAGSVDTINAVIRGVSVITSGLIARGHDLEVDATTLDQMKTCAEKKGQVPVKIDHKSGAAAVCGYLTNFHIDGEKLKADWHLLKTHPQKETILEVAERMPRGVGLSASFLPPEKTEKTASGKKAARCEELVSVDYVTLPAANPGGMFSTPAVDTPPNTTSTHMTPEDLQNALTAALAPITERLDNIEAQQQDLIDAQNDTGEEPSLEDLAQMSDEELAELGTTREEVDAALAEAEAAAQDPNGGGQGDEPAAGDDPAAGAPAGGDASLGAKVQAQELQAISRQITEFASELRAIRAQKDREVQDLLLTDIEQNFDALIEQNQHLQAQLQSVGRPASPGIVYTQFKSKSGTTVNFGTREPGAFEELVGQYMDDNPKATKATAFGAIIRSNPEDYQDYLRRRGLVQS